MQNQNNNPNVSLLAATQFKLWFEGYKVININYINIYYIICLNHTQTYLQSMDQYQSQMYAEFITSIKTNIINSYMSSQKSIANQLEQSIILIAEKDFPMNW
jgi:hypothetical protein